MRKVSVLYTAAALISLISQPALADEIDLSKVLKDILYKNSQVIPVQTPGFRFTCNKDGAMTDDRGNISSVTLRCGFKYDNIRAVSTEVSYTSAKPAAIPTSIVREVWSYANCYDHAVPINDSISVTSSEGSSITESTQVQAGSSSSLTTSLTIPIKAVSLGITAVQSLNYSSTATSSSTINLQQSRATTQAITISVPPRTVHSTSLERTLSNAYIDFDGVVTLDADVYLQAFRLKDGASAGPDVPAGKLSDFTSAEADRKIHLKGQIWNAKGIDTNRTDAEHSIPEGSQICPAPVKVTNGHANQSLRLNKKLNISAFNTAGGGIQTTQPLTSGMSITTSDSVANVEVRAESLGPGFCAVSISSNSGSTSFLAPPLTWSPWTTLFAHVGIVSATLTTSVGCDTGALFEVRYFK